MIASYMDNTDKCEGHDAGYSLCIQSLYIAAILLHGSGVEWSGNYRNLCQGSGKKVLTMTKESQTHIRNR
jgi:hypothetical protein